MKFPDIFAPSYLAQAQASAEEEILAQARAGKTPSAELIRHLRCCIKEVESPMPEPYGYISDGELRNHIITEVEVKYKDQIEALPDILRVSIDWENVIASENAKYQAITLFDTCERKYWVKTCTPSSQNS